MLGTPAPSKTRFLKPLLLTFLLLGLICSGIYLLHTNTPLPSTSSLSSPPPTDSAHSAFQSFIKTYKKDYSTESEYAYRFQIFTQNYNQILSYNSAHSNLQLDINSMADLTHQEYISQYTAPSSTRILSEVDEPYISIVEQSETLVKERVSFLRENVTVDWVTAGKVTPVRDQGMCGSCWAFAAVGAVESHYALKHPNDPVKLFSPQELIDCAGREYHNTGCQGGEVEYGFKYIKDKGIALQSDYPYLAYDSYCKSNVKKSHIISNYVSIPPMDHDALMIALQQQPVAVNVASNSFAFRFYKKGKIVVWIVILMCLKVW